MQSSDTPVYDRTVDEEKDVQEVVTKATPCGHRRHDVELPVHGGPAVAFGHMQCPDCTRDLTVPVCAPFVEAVLRNYLLTCGTCRTVRPASETMTIVMFPEGIS